MNKLQFQVKNFGLLCSYIGTDDENYLWKDGTLHKNTGWKEAGMPTPYFNAPGYWKFEKQAQRFLDKWMPKNEWLTKEEVKIEAAKGEKEALDCSIEHWKQIVLNIGHIRVDNTQHRSQFCAMCQRHKRYRFDGSISPNCNICLLYHIPFGDSNSPFYGKSCCVEWEKFHNNLILENAIPMLNKLIIERNRIYDNPYEEN